MRLSSESAKVKPSSGQTGNETINNARCVDHKCSLRTAGTIFQKGSLLSLFSDHPQDPLYQLLDLLRDFIFRHFPGNANGIARFLILAAQLTKNLGQDFLARNNTQSQTPIFPFLVETPLFSAHHFWDFHFRDLLIEPRFDMTLNRMDQITGRPAD